MSRSQLSLLGGAAILLAALIALAISKYDWNVSALLHVSQEFGEAFEIPQGVVLYEDGGYDGMLYYQVARDIPEIFFGNTETPQRGVSTDVPTYNNAYRAQRILLPLSAYLFSLGNESLLPFTFLLINIFAVLGALALGLKSMGRLTLHHFTLIANPAALVGILFSLTEPLSLFFTTLFLYLWKRAGERITAGQVLALSLGMLTRETMLFLIVPFAFLFFLQRKPKDALLTILSLLPFCLFQGFLYLRFEELGFATGAHMFTLPFLGVWQLLLSSFTDISAYRLSSLSLLFFFIFPLFILTASHWMKENTHGIPETSLLFLLAVLLSLDAHIWGVITSVGRVLAPLYPLYAFSAMERDSLTERILSLNLFVVSVVAAIGIASIAHPFSIS